MFKNYNLIIIKYLWHWIIATENRHEVCPIFSIYSDLSDLIITRFAYSEISSSNILSKSIQQCQLIVKWLTPYFFQELHLRKYWRSMMNSGAFYGGFIYNRCIARMPTAFGWAHKTRTRICRTISSSGTAPFREKHSGNLAKESSRNKTVPRRCLFRRNHRKLLEQIPISNAVLERFPRRKNATAENTISVNWEEQSMYYS